MAINRVTRSQTAATDARGTPATRTISPTTSPSKSPTQAVTLAANAPKRVKKRKSAKPSKRSKRGGPLPNNSMPTGQVPRVPTPSPQLAAAAQGGVTVQGATTVQDTPWVAPPVLPDRYSWNPRGKRSDLYRGRPLNMPTARDLRDSYRIFEIEIKAGLRRVDPKSEGNTKAVFRAWKASHKLNQIHDLDYATISGLLPWEMKAALDGNWRGLDHLLEGKQDWSQAPNGLKPAKESKQEWNLAMWVHQEKMKHDEMKREAKNVSEAIEEDDEMDWEEGWRAGKDKRTVIGQMILDFAGREGPVST